MICLDTYCPHNARGCLVTLVRDFRGNLVDWWCLRHPRATRSASEVKVNSIRIVLHDPYGRKWYYEEGKTRPSWDPTRPAGPLRGRGER